MGSDACMLVWPDNQYIQPVVTTHRTNTYTIIIIHSNEVTT